MKLQQQKNQTKIKPRKFGCFCLFSGRFWFLGTFYLEERMRAFKGQIKANKAMFRRRRLEGLFCLFLLLGFALLPSHAVKIRLQPTALARLDLDSISGAGSYNDNTTETANHFN
jgi:hypothetical protein